jgi:hypothetical protein
VGTIRADTRLDALDADDDDDTVIGFFKEEIFKPLIVPTSLARQSRSQQNEDAEVSRAFLLLWRTHDQVTTNKNLNSFTMAAGYEFFSASSTLPLVVLPRILPLPCPSPFPPGILGDLSAFASFEKLHDVLDFYVEGGVAALNSWACPMLADWLFAAQKSPEAFVTTWWAKNWMAPDTILRHPSDLWVEDFDSASFKDQHSSTLLQSAFLTLSWRMQLDRILAVTCTNPSKVLSKRFRCYLHRANDEAFSLYNAPLGEVPYELAGELAFLRPPSCKDWPKKLGLQRFIEPKERLPLVAQGFVIVPVDPRLGQEFSSPPLVSLAQIEVLDDEPLDEDEDAFVVPSLAAQKLLDSVRRQGLAAICRKVSMSSPLRHRRFPGGNPPDSVVPPSRDLLVPREPMTACLPPLPPLWSRPGRLLSWLSVSSCLPDQG